MSGRRLARVRSGYRLVAIAVLNTLVALALVQGTLAIFFWVQDRRAVAPDFYGALDDAAMARIYPDVRREDLGSLWREIVQPLAYQSFTEFQEQPRTGTYVNVDPAGFRHVAAQHPWPPDPAHPSVFVFGGSTTFGYGVPDADTIPSRLQPLLAARRPDVAVYNFGRGYYYSTQERLLFEQLLSAGHVPAVAVFIDGLNEFCFEKDDSVVSARLAAAFDRHERATLREWLGTTPVGRAAAYVQSRLAGPAPPDPDLGAGGIRHVIERYLANKRLIEAVAAAHGVTAVFVWQPVPMWHYDQAAHLFAGRGYDGVAQVAPGYDAMATHVRTHPVGGDFLWLADVQANSHDPLYVDIVHYTPRFAARLATLIDGHIGDRLTRY